MAPVASAPGDEGNAVQFAADGVHRFMEWWDGGHGAAAAKSNPVLACIEESLLSDVIAAGGSYHNVLTLDRLDNMFRAYAHSTQPELEPLRKALQTRGGAKNQARAVGQMLFNEARSEFERHAGTCMTVAACGAPAAPAAGDAVGPSPHAAVQQAAAVMLDEVWRPARRWVCSEAFPPGAQVAARSAPNKEAKLVTTFQEGTEFLATGRRGDYLEVHFQDESGFPATAYVPSRIGTLEILVPATPAQPSPEPVPAAAPPVVAVAHADPPSVALAPAPAAVAVVAPAAPVQVQVAAVPAAALPAAVPAYQPPVRVAPPPQMAVQTAPALSANPSPPVGGGRLEVLEQRVAQQDNQILSLQCELAELRRTLSVIASAFGPLAVAAS
eukprot:TRINITY_DN12616_c0_g1_i1.p1 TRINITY_DN12616_c0_g1~~TRINITY_DN12616_c0_g1_i1.p1  ORF type:complete len:384 (+),score=91.35 TRINITY_DN12616_c0_g1_i1:64-1215(+)